MQPRDSAWGPAGRGQFVIVDLQQPQQREQFCNSIRFFMFAPSVIAAQVATSWSALPTSAQVSTPRSTRLYAPPPPPPGPRRQSDPINGRLPPPGDSRPAPGRRSQRSPPGETGPRGPGFRTAAGDSHGSVGEGRGLRRGPPGAAGRAKVLLRQRQLGLLLMGRVESVGEELADCLAALGPGHAPAAETQSRRGCFLSVFVLVLYAPPPSTRLPAGIFIFHLAPEQYLR